MYRWCCSIYTMVARWMPFQWYSRDALKKNLLHLCVNSTSSSVTKPPTHFRHLSADKDEIGSELHKFIAISHWRRARRNRLQRHHATAVIWWITTRRHRRRSPLLLFDGNKTLNGNKEFRLFLHVQLLIGKLDADHSSNIATESTWWYWDNLIR